MTSPFRIQIGFDDRTVTRLAKRMDAAAKASTRPVANRTKKLLEAEVVKVVDEQGFKPRRVKPGRTKQDTSPRLRDSYEAKITGRPGDYRVALQAKKGTDPAKIGTIERGRPGGVTIVPRKATVLTGWYDADGKQAFRKRVTQGAMEGHGVMRKARDRVYQRIRRGGSVKV